MSDRAVRLLSSSIVTLAGAVALGLGDIAGANSLRGGLAALIGFVVLLVGGLTWLTELARHYGLIGEPRPRRYPPLAPPADEENSSGGQV